MLDDSPYVLRMSESSITSTPPPPEPPCRQSQSCISNGQSGSPSAPAADLNAVKSQGTAVRGQWKDSGKVKEWQRKGSKKKVKEWQWEGSERSKDGSEKAVEGQGKAGSDQTDSATDSAANGRARLSRCPRVCCVACRADRMYTHHVQQTRDGETTAQCSNYEGGLRHEKRPRGWKPGVSVRAPCQR